MVLLSSCLLHPTFCSDFRQPLHYGPVFLLFRLVATPFVQGENTSKLKKLRIQKYKPAPRQTPTTYFEMMAVDLHFTKVHNILEYTPMILVSFWCQRAERKSLKAFYVLHTKTVIPQCFDLVIKEKFSLIKKTLFPTTASSCPCDQRTAFELHLSADLLFPI